MGSSWEWLSPAPQEHWPAPDRVEDLLDGAPADPGRPGEVRLAGLVAALAVPSASAGLPEPLDPEREEAALSAFRNSRLAGRRRGGLSPTRYLPARPPPSGKR